MSFLIVISAFVRWILLSLRKIFWPFFLLTTIGMHYVSPSGWKVFNASKIETKEIKCEQGVMKETRIITQIGADYYKDGVELQLRHYLIGRKVITSEGFHKAEPCSIK